MNATTAPENPIVLNIQSSYGALMIGCFLSCAVWGMSCLQVYGSSDRRSLKLLDIRRIASTIDEILLLECMWPVLILQWGKVEGLSVIQEGIVQHVWVSGIMAICVQWFYLYRIYQCYCSQRQKMACPIYHCRYIPLAALHHKWTLVTLSSRPVVALNISLRACSACVDLFIAITMSYYLIKQGIPKFSHTQKMYFRLFLMTINTGMWTATIATLDFILMAIYRDDLWYAIFEWPLGSLYLCVLLANLNAREFIRGREQIWHDMSTSGRNNFAPASRGPVAADGRLPALCVTAQAGDMMMVNLSHADSKQSQDATAATTETNSKFTIAQLDPSKMLGGYASGSRRQEVNCRVYTSLGCPYLLVCLCAPMSYVLVRRPKWSGLICLPDSWLLPALTKPYLLGRPEPGVEARAQWRY
ncbi:uncharacterized protein B0H18DRAFT_958007 [Fomitopsis serialis]|uniref:uncharacterized protein n=1 Tax=Fomitopsis serialis TaxID=139415 RepID=UPI002007758C|nr:uncharacterized protein B0H18DRAFT_958007 [Neoantrodia serialis]KAH9918267.1 hypothetical protein B0H18DRAFT_958007 [Neoantrodia serialis]